MPRSLKLGRLAGIPIEVNWSVVGVAALVVYSLASQILPNVFPEASLTARILAASAGAAGFFLSILGHEMGHAMVARRHDVQVAGITLWLLGGMAKLMRQAPTPKAEFRIAAAGPAVNLAVGTFVVALLTVLRGELISSQLVGGDTFLAGTFLDGRFTNGGWADDNRMAIVVLGWLAAVNFLLAVSNLVPAAPLDGGRVLTAALWRRLGDAEHARVLSARCGLVLGFALTVIGLVMIVGLGRVTGPWVSAAVTGLFLLTAAYGEIVGATVRGRLARTHLGQLMVPTPASVPDSWTLDQLSNWAGPDRLDVAFPVVRWGREPIGIVVPQFALGLDPAERSWTKVAAVMTPNERIARAWTSESVDALLDRVENGAHQAVVVHDPGSGSWVGTLTEGQTAPLYVRPDLWGRARS